MRPGLLYILVSALLVLSGPLMAGEPVEKNGTCLTQRPDPESTDHRALTLQGLSCFEAGRYDWALTHDRAAFALSPEPVLLGTIGRSLQELGLYDLALAHYQAFLAHESQTPAAERIRGRIEELEEARRKEGAILQLIATPPGHPVALVLENGDWLELGRIPAEISLQAGTYEFVFTGQGYLPRHEKIRLSAGQSRTIRTHLISEQAAFNLSSRAIRRSGVFTFGVAVPLTAAGVTLLAMSSQNTSAALELERNFADLSDYDTRRRELLDEAATYRRWGTIGTGIGATGMIVGALLFSATSTTAGEEARPGPIEPQESSPQEARRAIDWAPLVSPNHLGFQLRF